jgi:hypothetical protein
MGGMSTMALAGLQSLFLGACFAGMYIWLRPSGLPTWAAVLASLLVALLFTITAIALHDVSRRPAMIRSIKHPVLRDGHAVVLHGRFVNEGRRVVTAPFSGDECAVTFFTISVTSYRSRSVILDGYSIAPCVFRTPLGDLRLSDIPPTNRETFLADPEKAPRAFANASALRDAGGPTLTGDWEWIEKVEGQDRFRFKRNERPEDVLSEIRVAGPANAVPQFLFEKALRTNEDLSLLAVWSERDQRLKSDPYGAGAMRIIATGGAEEAFNALRREMVRKAVKAGLTFAAGSVLIWVLATRIDSIKQLINAGQ